MLFRKCVILCYDNSVFRFEVRAKASAAHLPTLKVPRAFVVGQRERERQVEIDTRIYIIYA